MPLYLLPKSYWEKMCYGPSPECMSGIRFLDTFYEQLGKKIKSVPVVRDFKFVPLVFVTLGFGSQIPLLRAVFHSLAAQNPRVQTLRVQRKTS